MVHVAFTALIPLDTDVHFQRCCWVNSIFRSLLLDLYPHCLVWVCSRFLPVEGTLFLSSVTTQEFSSQICCLFFFLLLLQRC